MNSPVSARSYLERAKDLRKAKDPASLIYAALELRCGVEARLKEHRRVAPRISKRDEKEWEIGTLGRIVQRAFGLKDEMLLIVVSMEDGRQCTFMYAPVSSRLQAIGKQCGRYLHALNPEHVTAADFWAELDGLLAEGCALLELACQSEVLRPTAADGFHFVLPPGDPREQVIRDLKAGVPGTFSTATLAPAGPLTFYPAEDSAEEASG